MYIFAFYTLVTMKERVLGYIDVKSASGIYFYVQSSGNLSIGGNGVLPFNKIVLNIGSGMNLKSGVFTAPRSGTYSFSFSILKNGYIFSFLDVSLRVNGIRIGNFFAGVGLVALPIVQQSTLKLKKGDSIDLQKGKSGGLSDCPMGYCHHFSGWMLEEDLEL